MIEVDKIVSHNQFDTNNNNSYITEFNWQQLLL